MKRPLTLLLLLMLASCDPPREYGGGSAVPQHPDALSPLPTHQAPPPTTTGSRSASGTIELGSGQKFTSLAAVAPLLEPGQVVLLRGGETYGGGVRFTKSGTKDQPITIRGVTVDGKRPVISGGADTIEAAGHFYVFENLEITGGSRRCFFHHANQIVIKDSLIRDCKNGILGADEGSGSLTVERTELARSGEGIYHHPIYMATDQRAFPGSVFTLRHSYLHDGAGGNNVKSRAERNLIVENWIEGARYHEVELIGPDGQDPALAREDSEVVGNVIVKTGDFHAVRIGGDGTGDTAGRYRFVHNTFVLASTRGAIRLMDRVESIELYNNVFLRRGGGPVTLFQDETPRPADQPLLASAGNWAPASSSLARAAAGFQTLSASDLSALDAIVPRPPAKSALVGAGKPSPTLSQAPYRDPLALPSHEPPMRTTSKPKPRGDKGPLTAGALEP